MSTIYVVGAGYVGLAHACLFASPSHTVRLVEVDSAKLDLLQEGTSPLEEMQDAYADALLKGYIEVVDELDELAADTKAIFIAVPTSYNEATGELDTSILDAVLMDLKDIPHIPIVIKSTVPVGYTQSIIDRTGLTNICFSPEFLREGSALKDLRMPQRVVVGSLETEIGQVVLDLYKDSSLAENFFSVGGVEAETAKLFANTYLAMRVAYFNELDTYCAKEGLDAKDVLDIICLDPRIGSDYNNPSFGYGGYCLPKDALQAHQTVSRTHGELEFPLIEAIHHSNQERMDFIVEELMAKEGVIGFYDLSMKSGSDNLRSSASFLILQQLIRGGRSQDIRIYSQNLPERGFETEWLKTHLPSTSFIEDEVEFARIANTIVANRLNSFLNQPLVRDKVFSRDIYQKG